MASLETNEPASVRLRRQFTAFLLAGRGGKSLPILSALKLPSRGSLRAFWYDGLFTSVTDSLSLNYIPLFALKLGATPSQIGIMNGAAGFIGTMMLLPGARIGEWWGKRKSFFLWTNTFTRLTLLVLALIPFGLSPWTAVWAVIILNLLRVVCGNLGLPAWTSLSADIVPQEIRGRYFASRNGIITLVSILFAPLSGLLIVNGSGYTGYQAAFLLAFLSGVAAMYFFSRVKEPPSPTPTVIRGKRFPLLHRLLQRPNFVRFAIYSVFWNFSLNLAVPFFNVFLVEQTTGDEASVGYLSAVGSIIGLVSQQYWGQVNDRLGARRTLLITGALLPFITFGWLFVSSPWHVVPINIVSGLVWPGFNLATFTFVLQVTPEERRPRYVALLNTSIGIGSALGASVGGWLVETYGYRSCFLASGAMRIIGWLLLLLVVR